ncbi:MAG: hypothetical protein ACT4NX_01355 [Deltaproteobacteria bacterium]
MLRRIIAVSFVLLGLYVFAVAGDEPESGNPQFSHPQRYIKITDFSIYSARGVGIIHHVMIENTSDVQYKNVKALVRYYSTSGSGYGRQVAVERGALPVTLPPRSKGVYLEGGSPFGAIAGGVRAGSIEILGAEPAE